ncbi:MAG TPA: pyridoxamine 5'-phosphate oxidase [Mycobacteriales bacterium]|jgi:pyridoxamine 5'-phosphate oxidase|nr:pyridoxamine 5'-phosphate oxidase [Mycobacteriales bacterium]
MPDPTDLAALRRDYESDGIDVDGLPAEPLPLWQSWLRDAEAADVAEINAMIVSTVDADGTPTSRTVLCKAATEAGFVFFTNYASRKGQALAAEPRISLLFPWHPLSRQVIVTGRAEQVPRAESEAYFASRPRGSQISAVASAQSSVVPGREVLEQRVAELEEEFDGRDVPCPPHWGGFLVRPQTVEFWQGRRDRLHDRIRYRAQGNGWQVERLSP